MGRASSEGSAGSDSAGEVVERRMDPGNVPDSRNTADEGLEVGGVDDEAVDAVLAAFLAAALTRLGTPG